MRTVCLVVLAVIVAVGSAAMGEELYYDPQPTATAGPQKVSGGPVDILVDGYREADLYQMDQRQAMLYLGMQEALSKTGLDINPDPQFPSDWKLDLFRLAEGGNAFAAEGVIKNLGLAGAVQRGELVVQARLTKRGESRIRWIRTFSASQQLGSEFLADLSRLDSSRRGSRGTGSSPSAHRSSRGGIGGSRRTTGLGGGYRSSSSPSAHLSDRNGGQRTSSPLGGGHRIGSSSPPSHLSNRSGGVGGGYGRGGVQVYWANQPTANTAVTEICAKVAQGLKEAILEANSRQQ